MACPCVINCDFTPNAGRTGSFFPDYIFCRICCSSSQRVWRRPASAADLLATLPRTPPQTLYRVVGITDDTLTAAVGV